MKGGSYTELFSKQVHNLKTRKRSLNVNIRKQELVKITIENQRILKRLQDKKPTFQVRELEEERKKNEKLLDNI
jgi:trehalose-6-phosphate synthase